MEFEQLRQFLTLVETEHFARAAKKCGLSPSAFTRSIKRLEENFGFELFERDNRSVRLTYGGNLFREYARDILDRMGEFEFRAAGGMGSLKGEISIYGSITACYSILPPFIESFRKQYQDIHVRLETGEAQDALTTVAENQVDVSVIMKPDDMPLTLDFLPIMTTPLVFVAHQDMDLSGSVDLDEVPLVLLSGGLARERTDEWFRNKGLQPNIYAQVNSNEAILALVNLGCGVGVLPELVLKKSPFHSHLKILDLKPDLEPYVVGLCMQKKRKINPLVMAFWNLVEDEKEDRTW
ncbi:MAG: HTH-type transcriptional activator IlvY [Spirochaetales bacterium]|nr:HTH-type transcriptional activator IlvY [Spirochaetales bacterium]